MKMTDNLRGALFMMVSMAAFTLNDTAMKAVTQTLPLFQSIAMRGLLAAAGLALIGWATGGLRLRLGRGDAWVVAIRSGAEIAATALFLGALMHMPLANISAILQSLPLAVTLAAALVFGERVGWRRLTAIAVGFVGVLIVIRPGPDGFDHWSVMALGSVLCVVVRDLSTRKLSSKVPSVTVAIWAALAVAAMGIAVSLPGGWVMPSPHEGALILGAGGALVLGYLFAVMVMRTGDIAVVAPFRYTSLLWALLLGWLVFGTLPDALTLAGAALIVVTGIFTLWRDGRARRRAELARLD